MISIFGVVATLAVAILKSATARVATTSIYYKDNTKPSYSTNMGL